MFVEILKDNTNLGLLDEKLDYFFMVFFCTVFFNNNSNKYHSFSDLRLLAINGRMGVIQIIRDNLGGRGVGESATK